MSDTEGPKIGDLVNVVAGMHRGSQGLYVSRQTYGGSVGYLEIHVPKGGKSGKWRVLRINELQVEKAV